MKTPAAIQLYSVRDALEKDFIGTLRQIADYGYKGVEFAGFGGMRAFELKKLLDELGLKAVGSHTGLDQLTEKLDEVVEYNKIIGNKYIVIPHNNYESKEDYIRAAKLYDGIGAKIKGEGLTLLYHNHGFEFTEYNGEYGLDILFKYVMPGNMGAELDLGWVFYAGIDPAEYLAGFKPLCPLIHLKDFLTQGERTFTEIGNGIINVKAVAAAAVNAGVEWLIVEQDESSTTSMNSARINFENLKRLGLA